MFELLPESVSSLPRAAFKCHRKHCSTLSGNYRDGKRSN